jgi:aminoglycoside phosphotransferase (APT) family kinase protein
MTAPQEPDRALADDLAWASSELGCEIAEVVPVSPLRGREKPRAAFRLRLADGRQLKLRRLRSPDRAAELARLTEGLRELGIPQVVLRRGAALAVEWLDGTPICDASGSADRIEEAARLLGRIHATPAFDGIPLPVLRETAAELRAMQEELARLVREGRLAADTAARLEAAALERDPGRSLHGVVHGDFCPENFVIDRGSLLRVVDNEGIEIAPLALDLARVWSRWPMPEAAWDRFLAAYRSGGGDHAESEHLLLWKIRTLVRSAWYRVSYGMPGDGDALVRLRSLSKGL